MKRFSYLFLTLIMFAPVVGCGGPEVSEEADAEMQELESDTDYESEMMGESTE